MSNNYFKQSVRQLSLDEVKCMAPSVVAIEGSKGVSNKYSCIDSLDIVKMLQDDYWYPVKAEEVNCRLDHTKGYQKHMIRFQHKDLIFKDESIECVFTNSHDGLSSFLFMLGIFRQVCSNGLVVGDMFGEIKIRHMGITQNEVMDASRKMLDFVPVLTSKMDSFKRIKLSEPEQNIYADSVKVLLFPEIKEVKEMPLENKVLLKARRYEDQNKRDLWTVYNRAQENIMKGKLRYYQKNEAGELKRKSTRKIRSIDKNIGINRALWNLTEEMSKLKIA